jgi:S-adenosylmethionine:tRNA ribosyltransferase-isomerase
VDGIISGAHEPGESHYDVLGAFASEDVLHHVSVALETGGFRSHEFGDSVMIMRRNVETLARPA